MYANYLRERTKDQILEDQGGFVTYRYLDDGKTVYIVDIYTLPEFRQKGHAAALADCVALEAKERGCTSMIGTVVPSTNGSTTSLKVLLAYGMTLDNAGPDYIIMRRGL
jgi:ribosomal protein S18 acetylase RimI-like enzyme